MDELERWLAPLGLVQLAPVLQANNVNLEILPELSEADLEKLGLSLGHRKKLLKAAASLSRPTIPSAAWIAASPSDLGITPILSAEWRQLTVMFYDLVGSTELAANHDPEDVRETIGALHRCVHEAVAQFGGLVARTMGDGAMVYFGYPQAHEDDAERAVRTGLAIVEAMPGLMLPSGRAAQVRIGIATGLVVVGDTVGLSKTPERDVVGETPNLAARLQATAEPNKIVIAASTRRLLGDLFKCRDIGERHLKGFAAPVRAWEVRGEGAIESRFEALHAPATMTPLVGREEEVELLLRRWRQALRGEGQVVLLVGEPGIGKSRTAAAVQERIKDKPYMRRRYFCSPYHADSALYPIISQLEHAAGFEREDVADTKLNKLETILAPSWAEDIPLLADLLSLPIDGRYLPLHLTPKQKRERTLAALIRQLEGLARHNPVLLVFEDAHWSDPSSLDLLGLAVERVEHLPVLLVITFRPEFRPAWIGQPHVTTLTLSRLDRHDGAALAELVASGRALPPEILDQIVTRTDGVPLFVEELTKTVLESGLLREENGRYVLDGPLPPLAIPATLHASLMARLDRLALVKEVAQIGAAIGREFSYQLLAAVAALPDEQLCRALAQLTAAELIFARGTPPESTYVFKHVLVQETAYATLLRRVRQKLHARIADAIQAQHPDTAEAQPELLAHHYTQADLTAQAVHYSHKAGQLAIKRSANAEAIAHLIRGLELLKRLPASLARREQEIELQLTLGVPLIAVKGYSACEVQRAYIRARELCLEIGGSTQLFPALWGLWIHHRAALEMRTARSLAEELVALARRREDTSLLLAARHAQWSTHFGLGELTTACEHAREGMALYRREEHHKQAFLYAGHDPAVCAMCTEALALWMRGFPDRAKVKAEQSLRLAHSLSHAPTLAYALTYMTLVHQFRREMAQMQEHLDEMLRLAGELHLQGYLATGGMLQAWAQTFVGGDDATERIASLRGGLIDRRYSVTGMTEPYFLCLLAEVYGRVGDAEEGLKTVESAIALAAESATRVWEPELHRSKGDLLFVLGRQNVHQTESAFRQALMVSRSQVAKSLELRAATSLARLWREQGKTEKARDLLARVYGWFTEGFDTPDLKEASALLEALQ